MTGRRNQVLAFLLYALAALPVLAQTQGSHAVPVIFDTDIGGDIDDALALAAIHALESRAECKLLAVTVSKNNAWAAPLTDALNTFYGRGGIPIGMIHNAPESPDRYGRAISEGSRYPHDLVNVNEAPHAVDLLRHTLAAERFWQWGARRGALLRDGFF